MQYIILFMFCLLIVGCNNPIVVKPTSQEKHTYERVITYSNPVLINGSSFGHYFQSLYRLGLYNDMLKFTESGTVQRFGKEQIFNFYQSKLKFDFELGKLTNVFRRGDTLELTYSETRIEATRRIIRLLVLIENDTCRLILPSLNANPFY